MAAQFLCLDDIWRREWTDAEVPEFRAIVAQVHSGESWVSDGNFAATTFDLRLPRADLIVWIDRPRVVCAWRATRRVFRRTETHKLRDLPKALRFIHHFDRVNIPRIEAARTAHGANMPMMHLADESDTEAFLNRYAPSR
jgi:adenylate kinase family enzyme